MNLTKHVSLGILLLSNLLCLAPRAAASSDAPEPHRQLDQILQEPAFQQWKQQQNEDLPDLNMRVPRTWDDRVSGAWDTFTSWLDSLFRGTPRRANFSQPASADGSSLPGVLKVMLIVVIAAVLAVMAVVLIRSLRAGPPQGPTARILSRELLHEALQSGDALALGSGEWMDEVRRLAMQQNFRAVYRALYLALLSGLHAAGKIEHSRNKTNWFYVSQYRGPASERSTFSNLTDLFDRVWYGRLMAVNENLDEIRQQVAELTGAGRAA